MNRLEQANFNFLSGTALTWEGQKRALAVVEAGIRAEWAFEQLLREVPQSNPIRPAIERLRSALAYWEEDV